MTPAEVLAAVALLRELEAKATPGPWDFEPHGDGVALFAGPSEIDGHAIHRLNILNCAPDAWDWNGANNRAIIAETRNALAALLDAAELGARLVPVLQLVARRSLGLMLARDEDMSPRDVHAERLNDALDEFLRIESEDEAAARFAADMAEGRDMAREREERGR